MVGIRTNSSPLSCSCTISLLGSGKMEENKENDLRPPLPQSYAATVARQSTVPSTSTMPGKHRVCPSSGRSKKATWGTAESPSFRGFNQNPCLCNADGGSRTPWSSHASSPAPKPGQASALLPGRPCRCCSSLCRAVPQTGSPTVTASELHSLSDSSCCQAGFQELKLGAEVRSHWFCSKIATDSPEPVTPYPKEASTKLLQGKTG